MLPSVPPGRYFLRVQPQGQTSGATSISYTMILKRDVPMPSLYLIALVLLVLPPAAMAIRAASMESARWKESGYASTVSVPSSGDDE